MSILERKEKNENKIKNRNRLNKASEKVIQKICRKKKIEEGRREEEIKKW